jgi:hypothetical protein
MNKTARCPECGGDVAFSHPASVLSVCSYCRSVLRRLDVALERLGKVAPVVDIDSPLQLGLRGAAFGGFTVVGRLQLDHGAGTWNEWYLGLDNGKWLWLAEAQRQLYLTAPCGALASVTAPRFEKAHVGHTVHMPMPPGAATQAGGGEVVMMITEVHTAEMVSAQGELPWSITPGEPVRYVDLSGPRRTFGTLDYGPPGSDEIACYVGRQVTLEELQLQFEGPSGSSAHHETDGAPPRPSVRAARLSCPQCQGALELRAPDATLRVTCPYCRALVDVTEEPLRALCTLEKDPRTAPRFPLGSQAKLRGTDYTLIGHLRRTLRKQSFTWDEYVLCPKVRAADGFHYLIEFGGHYTLARPVHVGDVAGAGTGIGAERVHGGQIYRCVEEGTAEVVHISGEFPWAVELGEAAKVSDFAREGAVLSLEVSQAKKELVASLGEYLEPAEVFAAFGVKGKDERTYVAPHQINPHRAALRRRGKALLWTTLLMVALMVVFGIRASARRTAHTFEVTTSPKAPAGAEDILLSDPFTLGQGMGPGAVACTLTAPLDNSWVGADVALVNEDDGTAYAFPIETGYYHGYEDGESWSEGARKVSVTVPGVSPGRYVMRIEPSWPVFKPCERDRDCAPGTCTIAGCQRICVGGGECGGGQLCVDGTCRLSPMPVQLKVVYGVSRPVWGMWMLIGLALLPFVSFLRLRAFEQRRKEDL